MAQPSSLTVGVSYSFGTSCSNVHNVNTPANKALLRW